MDRATVYTQEQARSVDFLFAQRATMIGLGKLAQAAFGSNTVVRGLAVTPNSPAALNVLVGIGEIYTMAQVDATPWGALPADTTDTIVKQGLNMAAQTISTPAPSTSGYSINYLIEAQYQDQDNVAVVLPYYNSANPSQPLNGQGGGGAAQATERQGVCVIQAKAGIAAATGTQTTPSVDSGWTALAVVTVANGQATVTSGNISVPAGVPQITSLLQMMQTGSTRYAIDTSTTANQITISLTPPLTSYTDGQPLCFQAANNNTGPCNINAGPGNIALNGVAGAFQGSEIVAGKFYEAVYRANLGAAVVVGQSGGAQQIYPAAASEHAVQFGQLVGLVGQSVNLKASLNAAGTSVTFTADQIVAATALNGLPYLLPSFNKTFNGTTIGIGGMDIGSLPTSGYVAMYAAYNPTTQATGIFGTNAATAAGYVYSGANRPSGYTVTALIGVWPTNGSGQLIAANQRGRRISFAPTNVLSTNTVAVPVTSFSASGALPANAVVAEGYLAVNNSLSNSSESLTLYGDSTGMDPTPCGAFVTQGSAVNARFTTSLIVAQTLYYSSSNAAGNPLFNVYVGAYWI